MSRSGTLQHALDCKKGGSVTSSIEVEVPGLRADLGIQGVWTGLCTSLTQMTPESVPAPDF